jgi:hypothetical protein
VDWTAWWAAHGETTWASIVSIIVTAVFGYIFYRRAEKPKRLGWGIMSKSRIINAGANERANLNVVYKNHEVANPNILVLRVGNIGKSAIPRSDLPEPIRIILHDAKLLATEVMSASNPAVKATLDISANDPNVVELEPELFNKGESLEVQLVTDGELSDPVVQARVADGEVVQVLPKNDFSEHMNSSAAWIGVTAILILVTNLFLQLLGTSKTFQWASLVIGGMLAIGYVVIIARVVKDWRRRKYRWID